MSVQMARDAIDAFLDDRGTGVLSLARGDIPYAIPVSYGYERASSEFYFRLSDHPDSRKRRFLDVPSTAQFVVYDRTDTEWVSVIAAGELTEVPESALTTRVADALRRADLPVMDLMDTPPNELNFRVFRLTAHDVTGRTTASA